MSKSSTSSHSTLLKGGTIIAYDVETSSLQVLRDSTLPIRDDRIIAVGVSPDDESVRGSEIVDVTGKIVCPGFVDTHRHGWHTVYRTLAPNVSLAQYFHRLGEYAAHTLLSADDVYISQLTGLYQALSAGVTTTLDHAHHTWSPETSFACFKASADSGVRVIWSYAIHDIGEMFTIDQQFEDLIRISENYGREWKGSNVEIGIAYDRFGIAPTAEVQRALDLARHVTRVDVKESR
jgi:cytosine/adenosine deaminase-related metal-dependent hydrolase